MNGNEKAGCRSRHYGREIKLGGKYCKKNLSAKQYAFFRSTDGKGFRGWNQFVYPKRKKAGDGSLMQEILFCPNCQTLVETTKTEKKYFCSECGIWIR